MEFNPDKLKVLHIGSQIEVGLTVTEGHYGMLMNRDSLVFKSKSPQSIDRVVKELCGMLGSTSVAAGWM